MAAKAHAKIRGPPARNSRARPKVDLSAGLPPNHLNQTRYARSDRVGNEPGRGFDFLRLQLNQSVDSRRSAA